MRLYSTARLIKFMEYLWFSGLFLISVSLSMNICTANHYNKQEFYCIHTGTQVLGQDTTVFLLKIRHENNNIALASPNFWRLMFNILSACAFHSRL